MQIDQLKSIENVSLEKILLSLMLCLFYATILAKIYNHYSKRLGMRAELSKLLPILSLTVFLVIIVVKQSLALSLGLVGALSIVRFRTPLKEPEDLIFFFIAIGIGLGFASGQILISAAVGFFIFVTLIWQILFSRKYNTSGYVLNIKFPNESQNEEKIKNILYRQNLEARHLREERSVNGITLSCVIHLSAVDELNKIIKLIEHEVLGVQLNIIENNGNW